MALFPRQPEPGVDYSAADLTQAMNALIRDWVAAGTDHSAALALLTYFRDGVAREEARRHGRQCRYCCRTLWCACGRTHNACPERGERPVCGDCARVQGLVPAPVGKLYRETCTDGSPVSWMSQDFTLDGATVRVTAPRSRSPRASACDCAHDRASWTPGRAVDDPRCPHKPRVEDYLRTRAYERAVARGLIPASTSVPAAASTVVEVSL